MFSPSGHGVSVVRVNFVRLKGIAEKLCTVEGIKDTSEVAEVG